MSLEAVFLTVIDDLPAFVLLVSRGGWTSTCMAGHLCVCVWGGGGELRNAIIFSARSSKVKVSNFKQPLLGSVKITEVFEVVQ